MRWVHEGGISTPFIVRWPAGGLVGGRVVQTAYQLVNVMPTLLDAARVERPDVVPEGASMLPALRGEAVDDETLCWEHIGNAAIRSGRRKLVRDYAAPWELCDIRADRAELHDLAAEHPEVVGKLAAHWQTWADRVGVVPWDRMIDHALRSGKPSAAAEE